MFVDVRVNSQSDGLCFTYLTTITAVETPDMPYNMQPAKLKKLQGVLFV